jgi:hypothetical protein
MKYWKFIVPAVVIILVGGIYWYQTTKTIREAACPDDAMLCPDGTPVGRSGWNCQFAPCPSAPQKNITLEQPTEGAEIGLPLFISGQARVFENNLNYRLKDSDGTVLAQGFTTANAPDVGLFGPYRVEVSYPQPKGTTGTVEVFSHSAKDGAEINLSKVSVTFGKVEATKVKVFYPNGIKDPNALHCELVYGLERRVPKTVAVGQAALEDLLRGPQTGDVNNGYFSAINPGVVLNKLTIENGVAKADFNDLLNMNVAGSCRVAMIRAQITQTLKQFPTVKSVVISVNGATDTILQP